MSLNFGFVLLLQVAHQLSLVGADWEDRVVARYEAE